MELRFFSPPLPTLTALPTHSQRQPLYGVQPPLRSIECGVEELTDHYFIRRTVADTSSSA